jgi:hypothetical protein
VWRKMRFRVEELRSLLIVNFGGGEAETGAGAIVGEAILFPTAFLRLIARLESEELVPGPDTIRILVNFHLEQRVSSL